MIQDLCYIRENNCYLTVPLVLIFFRIVQYQHPQGYGHTIHIPTLLDTRVNAYSTTTVSGTILFPAQGSTTCWRVLLAMVLMIDPLSSLRTQLVQKSGKIITYLRNLTPYLTLYVFNWALDPGLQ